MLFAMGDDFSYGLNTLGPLCLWQCFGYRYGMEGKAWVNNYRNFAKRKTQRGKQVGEDIISQEN